MKPPPSMRCVCGHWDTEHAAFTKNIRPGKTRTFCDHCDCRSWLSRDDGQVALIDAADYINPRSRLGRESDEEMAARDDQIDAGLGTGYIGEFR
jgi:hypothetical protein